MKLSKVQQDYLKAIWNLEQTDRQARMKTVADLMEVKPPTVLAMFRQLSRFGLIKYDKKTGACLTGPGKTEAERLIRKHRLIETFLERVLGIEEPLLHNEAEKLEHVISDQLTMKIDEYLKYPTVDPHGSIIPLSRSGDIKYQLTELETDIRFRVLQIPMAGRDNSYCSQNGLLPGSKWKVSQIGPRSESFLLTDGLNFLAISDHMAEKITVSIVRPAEK